MTSSLNYATTKTKKNDLLLSLSFNHRYDWDVIIMLMAATVILAVFVLPTTAKSWTLDVQPAFRNELQELQQQPSHPIGTSFGTIQRWLHPKSRRDDTATEEDHTRVSNDNTTISVVAAPSWVDQTMARVVSIITCIAISQGVFHVLQSNRSEIATELANKMFSKESVEVMQTIQSILSNVHTEHGVVDVFGKYRTIDVLASIVAFSRLQRVVVSYERSMETDRKVERNNDVDVSLVKELAHYANYAHAAYGWTFDLALRWKVHFGGNNQTLVRLTGIHRDDIVKAEWNAKSPHRPAYFIVRDHERRSIVLCIRGTWSVNDMLTNLYCTSTSKDFFRRLFHREVSCHSGMLEAAKAVYSDADATITNELWQNPEYSLILMGHSLGGGCAALLGKMLENRYPTLKVYLFGAPCVVPERNSMNNNVISVIVKGDPFSCLSLGHIADVSMGIEYLCKDDGLRNEVLLRTRNIMNGGKNNNYNDNLEWCTTTMDKLRKNMNAEKLYPPGRILLLSNDKRTIHGSKVRRLRWWRWRRRRRRNKTNITIQEVQVQYFRDLLISANMFNLSKHLPSMYISTLNDFVKD